MLDVNRQIKNYVIVRTETENWANHHDDVGRPANEEGNYDDQRDAEGLEFGASKEVDSPVQVDLR